MAEKQDIAGKIEVVQDLLHAKFGVRKRALPKMLRVTGRRLPRKLQRQVQVLVEAETLAAHPKLARRIDVAAVTRAYQEVTAHLKAIDVADRRKGAVLGLAGRLAFNVLAVAVAFIVWMWWQGHL